MKDHELEQSAYESVSNDDPKPNLFDRDLASEGDSGEQDSEDTQKLEVEGNLELKECHGYDYLNEEDLHWEERTPDGAETVIGNDDRKRVANTHVYPWSAICSLRILAANNRRYIGTGWFVGPRTVITAGHVLFDRDVGGWAKRIEVIPGRNGSKKPFRSAFSTKFRSVRGWTQGQNREFDYGAIFLDNDQLGNRTGWFGIAALTDETLKNLLVNNSGYPRDKPVGTQWFNANRIRYTTPRRVFYEIDTFQGQSGSPIFRKKDGKRYVLAIHAYGVAGTPGGIPRSNSAVRINRQVYENLMEWRR